MVVLRLFFDDNEGNMPISENDLADVRQAWGDGLIELSRIFEFDGIEKARSFANELLDELYGFDLGPILFKPTLSGGAKTFRNDREGTLSYFVGQDPNFPDDKGFGIKYWREVHFHPGNSYIDGSVGMWMGWVTLIDKNGDITKVDKSWGYKKDNSGKLKIVLHHSSIPYAE